jgi:hypothetical protein
MRKETLIVYTFAFVLFGCGDEVTKVYNTYPDTSVSILESEKKLSKQDCDSLNIGDIVFIKDSASVYTCNGKEWISLRGLMVVMAKMEQMDMTDKMEKMAPMVRMG